MVIFSSTRRIQPQVGTRESEGAGERLEAVDMLNIRVLGERQASDADVHADVDDDRLGRGAKVVALPIEDFGQDEQILFALDRERESTQRDQLSRSRRGPPRTWPLVGTEFAGRIA